MEILKSYSEKLAEIKAKKAEIADQLEVINKLEQEADVIKTRLKEEVFANGDQAGYGWKAYAQVRKTINYNVEAFIEKFPDLVKFVTETVVNKEKIGGLVKGGLLKEDELAPCQEIKETKAFYLVAEEKPEEVKRDEDEIPF